MIEAVDLVALRERFGTFLSKLYYSGSLSLDQISHLVTHHEFFSFLERNDANAFLGKTYAEVARELIGVELLFDNVQFSPVYWAGLQYINIAAKARIPLRQAFLLCPLREMVAHFEIYHEMNDSQILQEFLGNERRRPILTLLMRERGLSLADLSKLTGISENTLIHYKRDNANLFKASFTNVERIAKSLAPCSMDFFRERSLFVPVTKPLLNDPEFAKRLRKAICAYYQLEPDTALFLSAYEKGGEKGIYLGGPAPLIVGSQEKKPIEGNVLLCLIDNSL